MLLRLAPALCVVMMLFPSCTTIMNNRTQNVQIHSNAPNTEIYVDGVYYGKTPNIVTLKRSKTYNLELKAPGYYPLHRKIKGSIDPLFFGNLLVGGVPMVLDLATGTYKKFESISATLPTTQEDYIAMHTPARNDSEENQSSDSGSSWGRQLTGIVVSSLISAAANEYLGTGNSYVSPSDSAVSSGGNSRKRKPNVTYWEPCSYCYGGMKKGGFSTGVCPKCLGKGKIKCVDWDAMYSL